MSPFNVNALTVRNSVRTEVPATPLGWVVRARINKTKGILAPRTAPHYKVLRKSVGQQQQQKRRSLAADAAAQQEQLFFFNDDETISSPCDGFSSSPTSKNKTAEPFNVSKWMAEAQIKKAHHHGKHKTRVKEAAISGGTSVYESDSLFSPLSLPKTPADQLNELFEENDDNDVTTHNETATT
jgi:hypothetical protein